MKGSMNPLCSVPIFISFLHDFLIILSICCKVTLREDFSSKSGRSRSKCHGTTIR